MPRSRESIREKAAFWFVRLSDPAHTAEDRRQFEAWHAACDLHREAYEKIAQLWHGLDQVSAATNTVPSRGRRQAAAMLVLGVGLGVAAYEWHFSWDHYLVGVGESCQIALADGSRVDLGAMTSLKVRYRAGERVLVLESGQAYIDVAADQRSLVVRTPHGELHDMGTRFEVTSNAAGTRLGVAEGAVEFRSTGEEAGRAVVFAGQQRYMDATRIGPAQSYDEQVALAWRDGRWVFRDTPLADVLAELNRHHARPVHADDALARRIRVSGVFRTSDREGLLGALAAMYHLRRQENARFTELQPSPEK